jgi:hypothetical membrane protein
MSTNQPISIRISALCGILGPIIGLIFITFSIYYSTWFNWAGNWLSDLGGIPDDKSIWASRGIASIIFNSGLVVSGSIGVIFASSLRKIKILNNRHGRIGTSLFILDMFTLCTVGIFPETTGHIHTAVSIIFFFLIALSLIFIGNVLRKSSIKKIGGLIIILGAFSLSSFPFFLIPRPWGSNAIIEMIPIISLSIFSIIFGYTILKNKFDLL